VFILRRLGDAKEEVDDAQLRTLYVSLLEKMYQQARRERHKQKVLLVLRASGQEKERE
jgi:hypothetical protein